jgi:hypothetical protein
MLDLRSQRTLLLASRECPETSSLNPRKSHGVSSPIWWRRRDSARRGMRDANCWDALVRDCAENAGISETLPDAEVSHDLIAPDFV